MFADKPGKAEYRPQRWETSPHGRVNNGLAVAYIVESRDPAGSSEPVGTRTRFSGPPCETRALSELHVCHNRL